MTVPCHRFNHLLLIKAVSLHFKLTHFFYYYHYQFKMCSNISVKTLDIVVERPQLSILLINKTPLDIFEETSGHLQGFYQISWVGSLIRLVLFLTAIFVLRSLTGRGAKLLCRRLVRHPNTLILFHRCHRCPSADSAGINNIWKFLVIGQIKISDKNLDMSWGDLHILSQNMMMIIITLRKLSLKKRKLAR